MQELFDRLRASFVDDTPPWRVIAAGGPIGIRFGRRRYRVPSLCGVKATRSLEGSGAVLLPSAAALSLAVALSPDLSFSPRHALAIPAPALLSTAVESLSLHGWDNATLQLVPTFAPRWLP